LAEESGPDKLVSREKHIKERNFDQHVLDNVQTPKL